MDKAAERETHDFMNVDSFSQLPFIRPAPPPKEKGIRLFGIEFGDNGPPLSSVEEPESAETTTNHHTPTNNNNTNSNTTTTPESGESSRRFECHYCCRNFPTSQALGGHQNAHKRERQHAKRQHLQSAMVHGTFPEGQVYGLMNYRFGSYASSPTMPYPTWNSTNSTGRFYGTTSYSSSSSPSSSTHHHHHLQQPINGSPLALWRIPNTTTAAGGGGVQSTNNNNHILNREQRSSLHPLPLFSGEELMSTRVGGPSRVELGASAASQNNAYVLCDQKTTVNDHVSLDLHL